MLESDSNCLCSQWQLSLVDAIVAARATVLGDTVAAAVSERVAAIVDATVAFTVPATVAAINDGCHDCRHMLQ